MKYIVEVRYRYQYDSSTALPGILNFFTEEELQEEVVCSDWDYVWAESAEEAIRVFTRKIKIQVEDVKLCEKYSFRFTEIKVSEDLSKKRIW